MYMYILTGMEMESIQVYVALTMMLSDMQPQQNLMCFERDDVILMVGLRQMALSSFVVQRLVRSGESPG